MKAIIIGNAPITHGTDIDDSVYDEVIRMNNFKPGYGLGERTTIWANGIQELQGRQLKGVRVWNILPLFTYEPGSHKLYGLTRMNDVEYEHIARHEVSNVYDEIGYDYGGFPHPSTGILTIRIALDRLKGYDIDICNFSFFKDSVDGTNKNHHYWGEDDGFDKGHVYVAKAHNGEREKEYVEELINRFPNLKMI